jgi:hypothetical protein
MLRSGILEAGNEQYLCIFYLHGAHVGWPRDKRNAAFTAALMNGLFAVPGLADARDPTDLSEKPDGPAR